MKLPDADRLALEALVSAVPEWRGMAEASGAVGLEPYTLLHCGPPAVPAGAFVEPTLNSAAVACVFEGWADTLDEGRALVGSGRVRFEPAQNRNVATPMAAVVSPSMRLIEMVDAGRPEVRAYAPVNGGGTGGGPAPRYGRRTPEALEHLRFLNGEVADALESACEEPIAWLPIVDHGLCHGDDLHLRHASAHGRLLEILAGRGLPGRTSEKVEAFLAEAPIFHLNFWMAAVRCALDAAAGVAGASVVTALGGNGDRFGLQVSGLSGQWFTVEATPPLGHLRAGHTVDDCVGAYGDSALVEAFGLGALAHAYCPDMQALHADFYHDDLLELPVRLLAREHPGLPASRARVGLPARWVVEAGVTPVVELGIVDRAGVDGGLGAGLYRPPLEPFAAACAALNRAST